MPIEENTAALIQSVGIRSANAKHAAIAIRKRSANGQFDPIDEVTVTPNPHHRVALQTIGELARVFIIVIVVRDIDKTRLISIFEDTTDDRIVGS